MCVYIITAFFRVLFLKGNTFPKPKTSLSHIRMEYFYCFPKYPKSQFVDLRNSNVKH